MQTLLTKRRAAYSLLDPERISSPLDEEGLIRPTRLAPILGVAPFYVPYLLRPRVDYYETSRVTQVGYSAYECAVYCPIEARELLESGATLPTRENVSGWIESALSKGYAYSDIAEECGVQIGTVKSWRARERFPQPHNLFAIMTLAGEKPYEAQPFVVRENRNGFGSELRTERYRVVGPEERARQTREWMQTPVVASPEIEPLWEVE